MKKIGTTFGLAAIVATLAACSEELSSSTVKIVSSCPPLEGYIDLSELVKEGAIIEGTSVDMERGRYTGLHSMALKVTDSNSGKSRQRQVMLAYNPELEQVSGIMTVTDLRNSLLYYPNHAGYRVNSEGNCEIIPVISRTGEYILLEKDGRLALFERADSDVAKKLVSYSETKSIKTAR